MVAVVLAALGVSYFPRQGAESIPASAEAKRPSKAVLRKATNTKKNPPAKLVDSCGQIVKQFSRFYPSEPQVPESCLADAAATNNPPTAPTATLHFVIALVPDPLQTHLPLFFDRSIEVIQQAAEDENYAYDRSWFPWNNTEKNYDLLSDQQDAEDLEEKLEEQPGVMIFRRGLHKELVDQLDFKCRDEFRDGKLDSKCQQAIDQSESYKDALVVFVVGEQPTRGISDTQFENALQWMQALQPDQRDKHLSILGPTFSGSLPSLARELETKTIPPPKGDPKGVPVNAFERYPERILIHSGTTSASSSVRWFQLFLWHQEELLKAGPEHQNVTLHFRTFYESDSLMTDRFLCYLQQEGYPLDKVAILSEDETAYGREPDPKEAPPTGGCDLSSPRMHLYYPRDIATLRSAYEQQSIFSAGKKQANTPSTTLRGDLSEPAGGEHDTVRSYGGQLTPLAQESVLLGITNILDSKRVEFVILRSSNTLDQLFLSEFLRRSYPGGRVVIDASDLVFRRGIQGASLRGVLLLSPYPLLNWPLDNAPKLHGQTSSSYRVFGQDSAEGIYIAARELFEKVGAATTTTPPPISDYAPPLWANGKSEIDKHRPATWISVVGDRQFWPVAVLNSNTLTNDDPNPGAGRPNDRSLLEKEDSPSATSQAAPFVRIHLPGEMIGLIAICLMLGLWHWYCCRKGSVVGFPRVRANFAPIPKPQHLLLIFLGSLTISYLGMTLALSMLIGLGDLGRRSAVSVSVVVVTLVLCGFVGCWENCLLPVVSASSSKDAAGKITPWRLWAPWLWVASLVVLMLLRQYFLTSRLDSSNLQPTFWRIVYLRSGVSPLLPQVLLVVGLYAWFWFSLQGLALFGDDRPVLPRKNDLPEFPAPCEKQEQPRMFAAFRMFSQEDAGDPIEETALPLNRGYLLWLAFFLPVTVAAFWIALGEFGLRSLGDRHFAKFIFLGVCLCVAMILAEVRQFLWTWRRLRQLLIFLDRLRLRRTLDAMKGLSWGSVWSMGGNVLEQRYCLISRQLESMRNLHNTLKKWYPAAHDEKARKEKTIEQIENCEKQGMCFVDWYVKLCDPRDPPAVEDITPLREFQEQLAATAACAMKQIILPAWQEETESLIRKVENSAEAKDDGDKQLQFALAADPWVRAAEEFFVLPYVGFIQNTIGRIRSIAMSILALFVAATIAVSSYPFDPLPTIGAIFLILFALVGVVVIFVYAEMHRDATLSYITNTKPGELGLEFWGRLFAFGVGPLIGLLTTLFPSLTEFVVSWLQPGSQAVK